MGQHKIEGASLGARGIDYKRTQGLSGRLKGPPQDPEFRGIPQALTRRPRSKRGRGASA